MTIMPVSDLRNYNEVLKNITNGEPVYLTKNGRGKYVIVDFEEYERTKTELQLMSELLKGEESAKRDGYLSLDEVRRKLGLSND